MEQISTMRLLSTGLNYPQMEDLLTKVKMCADDLEASSPELSDLYGKFSAVVFDLTREEWQELYTKTFDINGSCCLDVGYVLFGEDYKRGDFLVHIKNLYTRLNLECGPELPDYLPYMLNALEYMPEGIEKKDLVEKIIIPAISKMLESFKGMQQKQMLYSYLLEAIKQKLMSEYVSGPRGVR